jgi:hypothetical protein
MVRRKSATFLLLGLLGAASAVAARSGLAEEPPGPAVERPAGLTLPAVGGDAVVELRGSTEPGARVMIGPDGPADPEATYRWTQVEGPPAEIADPTRPRIAVTIPVGAHRLVFLLTVKDHLGERTARVVVPVGPQADPDTPRADAGDDQIGLVGRQITLNGSRSTPTDKVRYRWLQLDGPKLEHPTQDRAFYAFTPQTAGVYRFGLIVAAAGAISEPDEVVVTVGEPPSASGLFGGVPAMLDVAVGAARSLADRATLEKVAAAFDAAAERASLFSTFADLSSELTRRLDLIVSSDPRVRPLWIQHVFGPLTQQMTADLLATGIDLRYPQAHQQALTAAQKDRLQQLLSAYARGFRAPPASH